MSDMNNKALFGWLLLYMSKKAIEEDIRIINVSSGSPLPLQTPSTGRGRAAKTEAELTSCVDARDPDPISLTQHMLCLNRQVI
jgi:hypothetical protein